MDTAPEELSAPENENLDALVKFREQEDAGISKFQALIENLSRFFGSPTYLVFGVVFILVWIASSLWGADHGWTHVDKPPFFWLQGLVSAHALLLTIAVLIRQNRMAQLAEHRAHLDLQINLITERKVTALLRAHQGQDSLARPSTAVPADDELTKPADPGAILAAIKRQDAI